MNKPPALAPSDISKVAIDYGDDLVEATFLFDATGEGDYAELEFEFSGDEMSKELSDALHKLQLEISKAAKAELVERASKPVPCATCRGACCYSYDAVHLTADDIKTLRKAGVKKGYKVFPNVSMSGHIGKLDQVPRKISGVLEETACYFLRSNGCSIYEIRPQVCREYSPWSCGDTYEADHKKSEGKVHLRVVKS